MERTHLLNDTEETERWDDMRMATYRTFFPFLREVLGFTYTIC